MYLRSKHWRAHSKQQFVSRQVGCWMASRIWATILESWRQDLSYIYIFKMSLWEISDARWHIAACMSSPVNCFFVNAPSNSPWSDLSKGNFNVLWFAQFCFHLFWWQYCQVFQMTVPWSMRLLFRCTFCPRTWPTCCASTWSSQSSTWATKISVLSSWRLRRSWERETEFSWRPRCLTIQKDVE